VSQTQEPVGQSCFAVINMSDDTKISDGFLNRHEVHYNSWSSARLTLGGN
jgi:hypothetical protein